MSTTRETKQADERGRVSLGTAFANHVFLVETQGDAIIFRAARTIPESEAWLYENEKALALVREGLAQARRGQFAESPSLDEARRAAAKMDGAAD